MSHPAGRWLRTTGVSTSPPRAGIGRGIVAGLVTALVALGVAELVSAISSALRSPVLDVGDRVIDAVPPGVKDLAIDWFGTADKIALLVGIGVLLAIYAAVVGIVAVRGHLRAGLVGIGLFGVLGAAASLTARADRGPVAVVPSIVGALVGGAALWWLRRTGGALRGASSEATSPEVALEVPSSRRAFFTAAAGLTAAGVAAGATGRWLGARFSAAASWAQVVLPRALRPLPAVPSGVEVGVAGVSPFVTPNADFYRIDTALTVPQVPVDTWRLRIDGMVARTAGADLRRPARPRPRRGRHHPDLRLQRGRR